ncbi:zinc-dependent metalloprotease family protein [Cyanobium sp. Copco_Reservoir_LC18]|uniref:zinc-dependent metalloprotease family protein n=1 Tax=Cyanobium sp. Copco_Reservoir_LC18 TaxID=1328305 RepID=UPI001359433D|nr:zinc-dependent metalloprotease family protein [Cyanobium sp. Copco_Reservoir_LC18]
MTYTATAGGSQSLSPLFPDLSNQARRSSDTTLTLLADAAPASAEVPAALINAVLATTKASPPPRGSGNTLDNLEASYSAPAAPPAALFQRGVSLEASAAVATNSHQVLNDAWPGQASAAAATAAGPACGCRACSVLAVTTGDGAAAWDTTSDQAPLVLNSLVTLGTGVNLSDVFRLHSNPNATKTIYLDFDGYQINNTPWENGGNLSLKAFYSTFDSTILTEIQRIWQRVAEDFSPFNVNVTTQDPGTEALRKSGTGDDRWGIRVVFTSNLNLLTGQAIKNAGGGGTAYYNSFNWATDDVALVFNRGEYTAAETASHEVGHTLGLTHDGAGTTEYYGGHGGTGATSWGTIMGAAWLGNDEHLTQWSNGQYAGANNTQDDLATITTGNGFTYNVDDHGNAFSTATALTGQTFSSFGIIERHTDVDMFRFDTGAGLVSFNIVNASRAFINSGGSYTTSYLAARGANLDIAATLYRANGTVVQTFNPADLTTASISLNLDAGTYFLGIDGVGFGTPLASTPTGYTDYGSLGQYMVSGTVAPAGGTTTVTPPPTTTTPPPTSTTLQVIDPNGAVELLRDTSNNRVSVRVNGVTSAVRHQGTQITATQFADRQILAAETNASGQNQILWRVISTGQIRTWTLDGNWNFVSSDNNLTTTTSSAGLLLQQQFMVDANGTPLTTSPPPTTTTGTTTASTIQVIDPNGAVQLLRDTTNNRVSVRVNGLTSAVRFQGTQITATQFADRQILAAEANASGQNQILWKVVSTGQIRTWTLDRNWNFVSSDNNLTTPTSTTGLLLQQQFMVDASGAPRLSPLQPASIETVDPIIGGGTSLAPAVDNDVLGAPMAFDDTLTADPILTSDPILALTELASLGGSQPLATDPLASPFPAAGFGATPTTPWLVDTQPLL